MDAQELDREWSAWLEERKRPAPPDPEFTRRVMESLRAGARTQTQTRSQTRARPTWPGWVRTLLSPRPALAFATLALAAALAIRYFPAGAGMDREATRIKGEGFRIGYLLKRGASILPAKSGGWYRPGDRLQAFYSADRSGFIRFFSLDANGRIGCLSCAGADSISPAGQDKTFPFALELDADPADEALVGIWTPSPSDTLALEAWLRGAWGRSARHLPGLERVLSDGAPSGSRVSFFLLRKKVRP
ncbi:MAG: hypothetical protein JF616_19945 [Fibrobacteres bacterium]|jgi:hypothetical protein|nr:hypothetical protein [Fibrobacterota bacterium]